MADYRKYILALRKCAIEHDNDETSFAHIVVSDLCRATANLLETIEQEPVLDKIRSEIWDLQYGGEEKSMTDEDRADAYNNAIRQVIKIIDEYKTESEGEE